MASLEDISITFSNFNFFVAFVCNDKTSKSDMESILSLFEGKLKNENFCDKSDRELIIYQEICWSVKSVRLFLRNYFFVWKKEKENADAKMGKKDFGTQTHTKKET